MKLLPKARPVQINKLRLGGKDINTMNDLLKNFCVSEILALGSKFTQWLNRHDEAKKFASPVSSIFNPKNSKKKQATDLLHLFFPKLKGQSLENIFLSLHGNKSETKMLVNILNYIDPNVKLAIELMSKSSNNQEIASFFNWLEICSIDGEKSSEFCYQYGVFLKNIDKKKSKEWLEKAYRMGNEKARTMLKSDEILEIEVKGHIITMQRIESGNGVFYIAKTPISNGLFIALHCNNNNGIHYRTSYRKRSVCNDFLKKISEETGYVWHYPTVDQWTLAERSKKIKDIHPTDGEWCEESETRTFLASSYQQKRYRVAGYREDNWLNENDMSYLRPVLIVSQNPNLQ